MAQRGDDVRDHYGSPDIIDRVLAAVAEAGHRTDQLAAEMLYPFDQLHGREIVATREHVGRLRLTPGMQTPLHGFVTPSDEPGFGLGLTLDGITQMTV